MESLYKNIYSMERQWVHRGLRTRVRSVEHSARVPKRESARKIKRERERDRETHMRTAKMMISPPPLQTKTTATQTPNADADCDEPAPSGRPNKWPPSPRAKGYTVGPVCVSTYYTRAHYFAMRSDFRFLLKVHDGCCGGPTWPRDPRYGRTVRTRAVTKLHEITSRRCPDIFI